MIILMKMCVLGSWEWMVDAVPNVGDSFACGQQLLKSVSEDLVHAFPQLILCSAHS